MQYKYMETNFSFQLCFQYFLGVIKAVLILGLIIPTTK